MNLQGGCYKKFQKSRNFHQMALINGCKRAQTKFTHNIKDSTLGKKIRKSTLANIDYWAYHNI